MNDWTFIDRMLKWMAVIFVFACFNLAYQCGKANAQTAILELKLDEGSGVNAFADSTGNNHPGTCAGAVCPTSGATGAIGNAASFNGTQWINVANTSGLQPANTVAIQAYIKATTMPANGGEVASMGDSYSLRVLQSGTVRFFFYQGGSVWPFIDSSGVNVLDNQFHKLVGRKTATAIEIEIDGVIRGSLPTTNAISYTLGTEFNIGRHANGDASRYFTGVIDEVFVFDPVATGSGTFFPGAFIEDQGTAPRTKYTTGQISAFVPSARGRFEFPAPYGTRAWRVTDATDCTGSTDCIWYVGYSYWPNINYHVNSSVLKIFIGTEVNTGGTGINLFQLDKTTDTLTKVGPIFPVGSSWRLFTGEGWYWSMSQENKLYVNDQSIFYRYDVVTQVFTPILNVLTTYGTDRRLTQTHSSVDDNHHVGTLLHATTGAKLGCWYRNSLLAFGRFYSPSGALDECHLDKSGRYTTMLDDTGVPNSITVKIFDNQTGTLVRTETGPQSTLGHHDTGYLYAVGADNTNGLPNATIYYTFPTGLGPVIHFNPNFNVVALNHISHTNAINGTALPGQMVCGSNADTTTNRNELTCVRIDTTYKQMIVAPLLNSLTASGGCCSEYAKYPKGNLDVTGRYFIWTTNLGGSRLDAYLVKVPPLLLSTVDLTPPAAPTGLESTDTE